ncbi:MAG: hypothetical protein E6K18_06235 [Methanobacteriota archaeon]|nr:MAG: hypothetical protein E6K18_06235 [Euryarchaeota archaeon]
MASASIRRFSRHLSDALRLPKTAARIVELLARSSRQLSVQEIVSRVRMSERSVRGNLALLLRRGILERRAVVTAGKRLAYLYRLRPMEELMRAVRRQFARRLDALRVAAHGRVSPRTAGSSHN